MKTSFLPNLPKEVEEMKELVVRVRVARAGEGGFGKEVEKKMLACWPSVWPLAPSSFLLGCWDLALGL